MKNRTVSDGFEKQKSSVGRRSVAWGRLWLGAPILWGAVACISERPQGDLPAIGRYSPPLTHIVHNPWTYAEKVSKLVPNSDIFIGHGNSMLPLYPSGSVLVIQRIKWENLRPGMSVLCSPQPGNPFSLRLHLITSIKDGEIKTQGLNNEGADLVLARPENYLGVVVAAYKQIEHLPGETAEMSRRVFPNPSCTFRCHTPTTETRSSEGTDRFIVGT